MLSVHEVGAGGSKRGHRNAVAQPCRAPKLRNPNKSISKCMKNASLDTPEKWPRKSVKMFKSGLKKSLNIKFLGGILLGHPRPRRRDIPDKNFMQVALLCCFRQGVAGMSRDLGRDVPDLEKLYAAENFGLIFRTLSKFKMAILDILIDFRCHFLGAQTLKCSFGASRFRGSVGGGTGRLQP